MARTNGSKKSVATRKSSCLPYVFRTNQPSEFAAKNFEKGDSKTEAMKILMCNECGRPGHVKYECPRMIQKVEKFKKGRKTCLPTWCNLDVSEGVSNQCESDEEEVNACLMTNPMTNSEVCDSSDEENDSNDAYLEIERLLKALSKANKKISKLENENKSLQETNDLLAKENSVLKVDFENLHVTNDSLGNENLILKEEIKNMDVRINELSASIKNTFCKFDDSEKKLNMLLASQRNFNTKDGLGFVHGETSNVEKKTAFVKAKDSIKMNKEKEKGKKVLESHIQNVNNILHHNKKLLPSESSRLKEIQKHSFVKTHVFRRLPEKNPFISRRLSNVKRPLQNFQKMSMKHYKHVYYCNFCERTGHLEKFCYDKNDCFNKHHFEPNLSHKGPKLCWVRKND